MIWAFGDKNKFEVIFDSLRLTLLLASNVMNAYYIVMAGTFEGAATEHDVHLDLK